MTLRAGSNPCIYDDFIGFSFGDYHSSQFHILRVSEGNRYTENLIPSFQDKTVFPNRSNRTLYWNSYYNQKVISINIAFDSISEIDLREIRQWLNGNEVQPLVFDESPYKQYMAKIQTPPQLKYICFGEPGEERVYKGEGTIQFVCYEPFAFNHEYRYLDNFQGARYGNKVEWAAASGMLQNNGNRYDQIGSSTLRVYNAGDIETNIKFVLPVNTGPYSITINLSHNDQTINGLGLENIMKQGSDAYMRINTKTNLIEGCSDVMVVI